MKVQKATLALLIALTWLSGCASSPKPVVIHGENQVVETGENKSCRIVKTGKKAYRCVPNKRVSSKYWKPKFRTSLRGTPRTRLAFRETAKR